MIKTIFLTLVFLCSNAWAQTVVPIVWPFNPGSNQSNFVRIMIEDTNNKQKKYQFVFEHRPGAGGSIAMNHVNNQKNLQLVSNASAFFTRPLFYPNQSYDINLFEPIITQMTGAPFVVVSKKYQSFNDLRKQPNLTIGVINGSVVQLVAEVMQKNLPKTEIVFVPYNGTNEITRDVIGGVLDVGIDFPADLVQWVDEKKVNVIGITGKTSHKRFPTLASQGAVGFENLVQNYFLFVKKDVSQDVKDELHQLFKNANSNPRLTELYHRDYGIPSNHSLKQSQEFWQELKDFWAKQVTKPVEN
jgi:tripartite-type tricarboxylate transporter receptor subunit TctC